jgi:hypothetical protein
MNILTPNYATDISATLHDTNILSALSENQISLYEVYK